jgi:hypothetical protein
MLGGLCVGLLAAVTAAAGAPGCSDDPGPLFGDTSGGGPPPAAALEPAGGGVRRLLSRQYVGSVRVLLGEVGAAAADPPPDAPISGLEAIGAAQLALPPSSVEKYEQSARKIAAAAVADPVTFHAIVPCAPSGPHDAACFGQFITGFGRLAWRRPLTAQEVSEVVAVADVAATEYGTFEAGVEDALSMMLQSPYFLYLIEVGEPDPDNPGVRRLTPLELATRMSMFLVQATPNRAVLDLAESGGLDEDDEIRDLARGLLATPEAQASLASFYEEVFRLRELDGVAKDPLLYPQFTGELRDAMRKETLLFLKDIIWDRDADAREIFDGKTAFVDQGLAALYGVAAPASDFSKTTLPEEQHRAGILGQASFLARFSHPGTTSPTRRGHFVQSVLLCTEIAPPPADVNPVLPPDDGMPKTMKQRLAVHQSVESCAGCHALMDPPGLALENYDAIGAFRTTDSGLPIDPSGSIEGFGEFASAADLGALLREDPRATRCMLRFLFRQSMGHIELPGERPALDALDEAFESQSFRIQEILVELCASPAFQLVGEPK